MLVRLTSGGAEVSTSLVLIHTRVLTGYSSSDNPVVCRLVYSSMDSEYSKYDGAVWGYAIALATRGRSGDTFRCVFLTGPLEQTRWVSAAVLSVTFFPLELKSNRIHV